MPLLRVVLCAGSLFVATCTAPRLSAADNVPPPASPPSASDVSDELARLYREDQADRTPPAGQSIEWSVVGPRDKAREARVKELYATAQLKTAADYYHAAMILQHAPTPEDSLLAHELAVVAVSQGHAPALWLAAAAEDRFLRRIGRRQRFGTQLERDASGQLVPAPTDSSVTAEHRRLMTEPPAPGSAASPDGADSEELARLYAEDQGDRRPPPGKSIDWSVVGPRDRAREARIKELYATSQLRTGLDNYHAAMVLQHGGEPEDYLLAHELCVVALSKGHADARWLAAAAEDRFLRNLDRPQRFGTQFRSEMGGPMYVQETDPTVTDAHREAMKVPPLHKAHERARTMNAGRTFNNAPRADAPPLTQELFAAADDAVAALAKLRKAPAKSPEEILQLQRAYRDYCARFPEAIGYADVRILAANTWHRLRPEDLAALDGWDAAAGESDPRLSAEQRGALAVRLAYGRAAEASRDNPLDYENVFFETVLAAAVAHPESRAPRAALADAALAVAPEKALPTLRERFPDDPSIKAALEAIALTGQPLELALTDLEGRPVELRAFRGKVVLVNFWAKRFAGSTDLAPHLKDLVAKHGSDQLALLTIDTSAKAADAAETVRAQSVTWPVIHDGSGGPIVTRLHARILPYYLLLDREGRLRHRGVHPMQLAAQRQLAALLAEPAPAAP